MKQANTMRANAIQGLVRRLLTHEAAETPESPSDQEALLEAAERVSDKLRAHLSKRIGQEGFRTLLARALTLTAIQFPNMSAVRVESDGSLVGLRGAASPDPQEPRDNETQRDTVEGAVTLIAHVLALLIVFIGQDLTLRLLSTVWPGLDLDDMTGLKEETP